METNRTEPPEEVIIKCEVIELSDEDVTVGDDNVDSNEKSNMAAVKPKRKRIKKKIPLDKYVQCDRCSKRFATNSQLKKHTITHTGERPYVCAECGKTYRQLHTLRAHEFTHTETGAPKNFACHGCGAMFGRKTSLRVHERIHTGEKPFTCTICQKSFTQKINLVSHIKVHQDDRKYECNECDKKFITRTKLNQHYKKHINKRAREKRKLEASQYVVIHNNMSKSSTENLIKKVTKNVAKKLQNKMNTDSFQDFSASDEETIMTASPLWSVEGDGDRSISSQN